MTIGGKIEVKKKYEEEKTLEKKQKEEVEIMKYKERRERQLKGEG